MLAVDNAQSHVTAFRPISEAARSWSDDNNICLDCWSTYSTIGSKKWQSLTSLPSRRLWSLLTVVKTLAACSPPMTDIRAFGHMYSNRGLQMCVQCQQSNTITQICNSHYKHAYTCTQVLFTGLLNYVFIRTNTCPVAQPTASKQYNGTVKHWLQPRQLLHDLMGP